MDDTGEHFQSKMYETREALEDNTAVTYIVLTVLMNSQLANVSCSQQEGRRFSC